MGKKIKQTERKTPRAANKTLWWSIELFLSCNGCGKNIKLQKAGKQKQRQQHRQLFTIFPTLCGVLKSDEKDEIIVCICQPYFHTHTHLVYL